MPLSEEEQRKRREAVRGFAFKAPYISLFNMDPEIWTEEEVRIRLPFDERLTNDGSYFHGGVMASLMDTAGAMAVWAGHDFDKGAKASTVSMSINYLGAAAKTDLIAEARCVKRGREIHFSEIKISDANGKPVASGVLAYRIVP
ncbi:MAG: PaaI family thioesterase [Acidimicrobiia bacterium]